MVDEVLPASLEKLEIDRDTQNSSRSNSTDKSKAVNPFRTITRGINPDTSYLFRRKSMPNRPASSSAISPRGVKTTTNFKPSRNERVLEKPKKNSIIKEAVLKLNNSNSNYLSENLASTLLEEACKLSISSKNCKTFGRGSVTKDFKALNISPDSRLVKDDASIEQESFNTSSFQRVRSNTMPSLKRGPGPGGGDAASSAAQNDVQNSSGSTQNSSSSTCSIQARISPPPCDVTIDELASYFDEFVHIPKKMSHMAEMMYI